MTTDLLPDANARAPPGPGEPYSPTQDLLGWMLANFERYGDIYKTSVHGSDVYVINSPELAEQVLLRNWENFPRAGPVNKRIALSLGNGLMSSNGSLWVKQRRMLQPAFTHEAVGAHFTTFVKLTVVLRERWKRAAEQGVSVDVTQDVSTGVLDVMLLVIFGEDYPKVAQHFRVIGGQSRGLEFASRCSLLKKIIIEIAVSRRGQGRDTPDLLGMMLRARDRDVGQPMSDAQLANEALTLVVAGHETTASVLNWVWYLLARHPDVEARLVSELNGLTDAAELRFEDLPRFIYTRQVLEEALRSYPPGWLMARRAIRSDRLGGYLVPAGTEIYISPYLLQRHPRLWRDPDRFDPARFASESAGRPRLSMCPFSAGPRNCIGEFFARVEMQTHVMLIAKQLQLRYDSLEPADFIAGVNLLSRGHFVMQPLLREAGIPG
jgi:enediyne biosynthesis protein E7